MYQDFFRLTEMPFTIVPNPKFYFLSDRHREALNQILAGIEDGGGMALLIGEVGTGKTITMKALVERLPESTEVASILNPSASAKELLESICDALAIPFNEDDNFKRLHDQIAGRLFENEERGIRTVLLVDEAQHLQADVLEQLRLLTNIETTQRKLLKVILIGQPELQDVLKQPNLRQLTQRITARYQLMPLSDEEIEQYILHRLSCAGRVTPLFDKDAIKLIVRETMGVPRLINLVCDQALRIAFRENEQTVTKELALRGTKEVLHWHLRNDGHAETENKIHFYAGAGISAVAAAVVLAFGLYTWLGSSEPVPMAGKPFTVNAPKINQEPSKISAPSPAPLAEPAPQPADVELAVVATPIQASSNSDLALDMAPTQEPESEEVVASTLPADAAQRTDEIGDDNLILSNVSEPVEVKPIAENEVTLEELNRLKAAPQPLDIIALDTLAADNLQMIAAMQTLYKLWGFDVDEGRASCLRQVRGELSCYGNKLTLSQLLTINRPAVLEMQTPMGEKWYSVLYGVGEGQFELLAANKRVLVSEQFLNNAWTGQAKLLWRPILGDASTISAGNRGDRVLWLDSKLNLVLGENSDQSAIFDAAQQDKVKRFQYSKGLAADGIAGALTFMMLNSELQSPGPRLLTSIQALNSEKQALADNKIVELPLGDAFQLALSPLPYPQKPAQLGDDAEEYRHVQSEQQTKPKSKLPSFIDSTRPAATSIAANAAPAEAIDPSSGNLQLEGIDLSDLDPELAKKVQIALHADAMKDLNLNQDIMMKKEIRQSNVVPINELPNRLKQRLPAMNFQAHIYATGEKGRWVRVNNQKRAEGEFIADGVLLRDIEPQQVVVQFEDSLIAIPALSTW